MESRGFLKNKAENQISLLLWKQKLNLFQNGLVYYILAEYPLPTMNSSFQILTNPLSKKIAFTI